ncbi:hypothetical protein [Isoptericola sp. 178]|uniref:hypothetical protein n=1 Tax=Isoptericola sp. 178 TaxID=3064651 RepID=UPI002712E2F2|nr:hypothetical protein [Isoptericola sp. 178]MDO8143368.1 hypothetical protein [Isoptericola sp. 178]
MRPTDVHHDVPDPDGDDAGQHGGPEVPVAPPWASATVGTDVPALDDVLGGRSAAGPQSSSPGGEKGTRRGKRGGAGGRGKRDDAAAQGSGGRRQRAADAGRDAADKVAHRAAGMSRRGVVLARSRPGGRFARRSSLLVVTAAALIAGVGAGAGFDAVSGPGGGSEANATLLTTAPETCAAAQVAWSRAAAAQVQMDLESPKSLRTGFVAARNALTGLTPPAEVAADWSTVATYVTVVADAAEEAEASDVEAAVAGAMAELDTAAMAAASERVTKHLASDCGATDG